MPNQAPSITATESSFDITRVSVDAAGAQGNAASGGGAFSPDGNKIAFSSNAANLVPGTPTGKSYLFLKDLTTGAVTLVYSDVQGNQGNVQGFGPAFSPDGSKIAYAGTGDSDLFIKDLTTGAVTEIPVDAVSIGPAVFSPDGSKIAFASSNGSVAHNVFLAYQVYVKDFITGALTSVSGSTSSINFGSTGPSFSPDGSKVAFYSDVRLVEPDTSNTFDVFVKDLTTGAITRISPNAPGVPNASSRDPVFSPDGSKIAFDSNLSNLVAGDTNNNTDVFIKDLATGTVTRVSVDGAGAQLNGGSAAPVFSPDGSKIAFYSDATNLVAGDTNGVGDIFIKDLATGAVTRVSLDANGGQANASTFGLVFSPDGSRIMFSSSASNLVPGDTNGQSDIFIKNLTHGHEHSAVYLEHAAAVAVNTQPVTITDTDNTAFGGGSLTAALTAGSHAGDGLTLIVSATPGTGIEVSGATVSYNGTAIGTLSGNGTANLSVALNASADVAAVQALAGAVGFFSGSSPTSDARTVTFTLVDGSGTAGGGHDTGSFTQTVLVITDADNQAPQISFPNTSHVSVDAGQTVAASSLFIGTDAEGDVLTYYVCDNTTAANSGHFMLDGSALQDGTVYTLTAAQLAQTTFVAGAKGVSDDILVMAYDGHHNSNNSNWSEVFVDAHINRPPQLTFPNGTHVATTGNQTLAVSSLFVGSDLDHDVLTYYVYDKTTAANSGHFVVDGFTLQAGTVYTLTADQLSHTTFVAGDSGVSDDILVMAYDGQAYSNSQNWNEFFVDAAANQTPTIGFPHGANVAASAGQSLAASSLWVGIDLDHDVLTYYVCDNTTAANSGHFVLDGSALQAGTVYTLTADQYTHTSFVAGDSGVSDDILVMTYDGHNYSNNTNWNEFHVNVNGAVNQAPQISFPNGADVAAGASQTFAASSLFTGTDAENDVLTYYVCDNTTAANSGHFVFDGSALQAGTVYTLTADQLALTSFIAGDSGVSDNILVMANDGHSNSNNTNWNELHVNAGPNQAPQISFPNGANVAAGAGQTLAASSLWVGNDAEHDVLTYYVCDNTTAANSGHFVVDGSALQAGTVYTLTADQYAHTSFVAGASGASDDILVMAYDGHSNSNNTNWSEFHILV